MKYILLVILAVFLIIGCKAEDKTQRSIAMILVKDFSFFDETLLTKQLSSDWNSIDKIEEYKDNNASVLFRIGKSNVVIAAIPNPLGSESLDYAVETAWYWENAIKDLSAHNKHYIVYVSSDEMQRTEIYLLLNKIVYSICKLTKPIGIYWSGSSQVMPLGLFNSYSEKIFENLFPTPLWIKVTGFPDEKGGYFLYTIGLKNFKFKEIEIINYPGEFAQGFYFLTDIADAILKNNTVLRNGDSININNKSIRIQYKKSILNEKETVISIIF